MATTLSPLVTIPLASAQAGFAGFICEVSGAPVTPPDCLACAQNGAPGCPMTPALVERIITGIRPLQFSQGHATALGAQFGISVTELIGCPRRFRLVREYPYHERPTSLSAAHRGTARHADLALYGGPGLKEFRLAWMFTYTHPNGAKVPVALTGQPDLLALRDGGWFITDYKDTDNPPRTTYTYTCHVHPDQVAGRPHWRGRGPFVCPQCGELTRSQVDEYIAPPAARPGHAMQINLLALLVSKCAPLLAEAYNAELERYHWVTPPAGQDTPVSGGEIAYLGLLRCPVAPDTAAALALLKRRLAALLSPDLPPILADKESVWECGYCPLKDTCEQLHGGPVGRNQFGDTEG
ncbi:MAG: hypothetical protein WCE68_08335 [Anaerolineales bacterium]